MGPPDSHGITRDPRYSGYSRTGGGFRVRGYHPLRRDFPDASATLPAISDSESYNPAEAGTSAVWAVPRSLATTWGITFVFSSSGYLDVSVPGVRLRATARMTGLQPAGLPHSEIPGSKVVCTSPGLIAAYHVFHRLPEPRHPPMCPFLLSPPRHPFGRQGVYLQLSTLFVFLTRISTRFFRLSFHSCSS